MDGIPNELFPMVIMENMANFDVSRILIDEGNSYDIMYAKHFEKLGLKREVLSSYVASNLQDFNKMTTRPWGYKCLMVTLEEGRDTRTTILKFLVISCKSVYKCILIRPFTMKLNIVASLVHLKTKYHNFYAGFVTICVDIYGARRIHKAQQFY